MPKPVKLVDPELEVKRPPEFSQHDIKKWVSCGLLLIKVATAVSAIYMRNR